MKKMYLHALAVIACGAMMACNNGNAESVENDSVAIDEVTAVDTVKYVGYTHGGEQAVEFFVADDQLVKVMANGEEKPVLKHKQVMVVYGEAEPTAVEDSLRKEYKQVKAVSTSVVDRMDHGDKNNAWMVLYSNEECGPNCLMK